MPSEKPFIVHAHGFVDRDEAVAWGCRQNHKPYRAPPRRGPLYAMLPFPLPGVWRVAMQTRYHGNGVLPTQPGTLLTAAFRVVVKEKALLSNGEDDDSRHGLVLKRGMCRYENDLIDESDNENVFFDSGELEARRRQWYMATHHHNSWHLSG
eukprot:CAMPEP_0168594656 /NCGR_PEP_ID=MMETSP0420-20121227/9018_1 /TAXON_ID=498008 /ORGANISM="Pessonella sp." /LENGTH=151 /DNA_ID=CAMNT_0008630997 /DNA_START=1285 /DNA_END=1736 /DNA_ORIENTATION=-